MAGFFSDISIPTVITSLVGSGAAAWLVVKGLSTHLADRWLARYKGELDKEFETYRDMLEQKRKRSEAELSHHVYTTQTQFDTEFNAIKDIFADLGKLRLSFNSLRPTVDSLPSGPEERMKLLSSRYIQFTERYNKLVDTAESVFPFVPEDVYAEVGNCLTAAGCEIRSIEQDGAGALTSKGYFEGAEHRKQFTSAYLRAAKLARERFDRMTVASH